ncbi:hypothetical protein M3N64_13045 [Sporolactobacillus sp. CPB3-1]|uniref:YtxH domain-containing protein n=1 Tax=Sporolactobacillus mangiferae TaxID=2940498 RepID=A0ABT0MDA2_9BACL|nr:hypothetical protein [Sporolactobacillus mangiferae]MCL1632847.1 hypothetical protein [Sporolactobacillus mangiferae]
MGNGTFWSFVAGCGATAAFFWLRGNQNKMPKWAKQPMDQMGKAAQNITDSFSPQS